MASLWELRSYFTNETLNNDFDNISVDEVTSHLVRTSFRLFHAGLNNLSKFAQNTIYT